MVGIQRGSEDFKTIVKLFQSRTHKLSAYNARAIQESNPEWKQKYDPVSFAESLRNIAANLTLVRPPKAPAQSTQPTTTPQPTAAAPSTQPATASVEEDNTMDVDPGYVAPGVADVGIGEDMISEHHLLATPKHVIAWVDTDSNQNNRLTLYLVLPPGYPNQHYVVTLERSGREVFLKYTWPDEMLDPQLLMMGHNYYDHGHNKIISFMQQVMALRNYRDDNPVISGYRIHLPFQVEEQMTGHQVPRPTYTTTLPCGTKILGVELMGVRTNYKTVKVTTEYSGTVPVPMSGVQSTPSSRTPAPAPTPSPAPGPSPSPAQTLQQQQQLRLAAAAAKQQLLRKQQTAAEQQRLRDEEEQRLWDSEQQRWDAEAAAQRLQDAEQQRLRDAEQQRLREQKAAEPSFKVLAAQAQAKAEQMRKEHIARQQAAAAAAAQTTSKSQQKDQSVSSNAAAGPSSLQRASQLGKQSFTAQLEAASIRKNAAWMLQLADNRSNSDKALKGMQQKDNDETQDRRKLRFKSQPSGPAERETLLDGRQASVIKNGEVKRQAKVTAHRMDHGAGEGTIHEFS